MSPLPENLFLRVVSEIHDPVTTTDELIPSGETSSYRSNPIRLSEFALSRKDPGYVARAKEVKKAQDALLNGDCAGEALPPLREAVHAVKKVFPDVDHDNFGVGSVVFAIKPGDGSAREQAASCQKVLGCWANIAKEYATKRYRSNLINWGMLPFITGEEEDKLSFGLGDFIFVPGIRKAVSEKKEAIKAFVIKEGSSELQEIKLSLGSLTDDEIEIILDGCLINYYRREA
jgi:aconitate hydratase